MCLTANALNAGLIPYSVRSGARRKTADTEE